MADWKSWLIETRYRTTLPLRCVANHRRASRGESPSMILFYHRVADDHTNAWTISNSLFERQINWIRQRFEIVSLSECQARLRSGNAYKPTVTITFDDGYSDNCSHALPFLIRHGIPCTYFVTLDAITNATPFPHDVTQGVPLAPNSIEQIRSLSEAGIEIGAHTRTHPDLGRLTDTDTIQDEVVAVKSELESITNQPVSYFAFPYGMPSNITQASMQAARAAGYEGVCSAYGGYNLPHKDTDFFHLRRIHADPDMSRLKNWLTFDTRKLRMPEPDLDCTRFEHPGPVQVCVASDKN